MKLHPILFSGPMIRAIRDGRKTQTRRLVTFRGCSLTFPHIAYKGCWPHPGGGWVFSSTPEKPSDWTPVEPTGHQCPYGQPGDRLWVRETWHVYRHFDDLAPRDIPEQAQSEIWYEADDRTAEDYCIRWGRIRQSIFMPRWASRLTLEITDVRVQRVQEISEEDAMAEGAPSVQGFRAEYAHDVGMSHMAIPTYDQGFAKLWDGINGTRAPWSSNPWVWAITLKVVT